MFKSNGWSTRWMVAVVAFTVGGLPVIASPQDVTATPTSALRTPGPVLLGPPTRTTPNLVLIMLDDARVEMLRFMPIVQRLLVDQGISFKNSYVVNPLCCPSRASFLTGDLSHTTGVYTNDPRHHGGFAAFRDGSTIATWLDEAGYRTAMIGKYFNGYGGADGYVPPGWDEWFATFTNGAFYDYLAVANGEEMSFGDDPSDYGTTVLRERAVRFIRTTEATEPLFLYFAPHAPHEPATPEARDRKLFTSEDWKRSPSFDEADVSDKPNHVSRLRRVNARDEREIDRFRLRQVRSLQSVDRAVAALVDALRDTDRLENTMIVFASDNGMLWGEHRLRGKSQIYEEAIEVPLVVRYDAMIEDARVDENLVLNIDVAPTFAALAGVAADDPDGRSFLPLIRSRTSSWRDAFLIEHMAKGRFGAPTFCAIHTSRDVLVRYDTGEEELYDLVRDPHQLLNVAGSREYRDRRRALQGELRALCDPLPPGFSF
jgi:N-acetylglucosamine-6-sulfatase